MYVLCSHAGWPGAPGKSQLHLDSQCHRGGRRTVFSLSILPIALMTVSKGHQSLQDPYLSPYAVPTKFPRDYPPPILSMKRNHGGMKLAPNSCLSTLCLSVSCSLLPSSWWVLWCLLPVHAQSFPLMFGILIHASTLKLSSNVYHFPYLFFSYFVGYFSQPVNMVKSFLSK